MCILDSEHYPARWLCNGRYNFQKHYYPRPGELDDEISQEETACAVELDSLDEVDIWVRNLERQPQWSFWLPTSTDRFYPFFGAAERRTVSGGGVQGRGSLFQRRFTREARHRRGVGGRQ